MPGMAGARAFIERLTSHPTVSVAVATGGWRETAEMKLRAIGLDPGSFAWHHPRTPLAGLRSCGSSGRGRSVSGVRRGGPTLATGPETSGALDMHFMVRRWPVALTVDNLLKALLCVVVRGREGHKSDA